MNYNARPIITANQSPTINNALSEPNPKIAKHHQPHVPLAPWLPQPLAPSPPGPLAPWPLFPQQAPPRQHVRIAARVAPARPSRPDD